VPVKYILLPIARRAGCTQSYLHKELKKNLELRDWLKEKAKQERLKKKQEQLKR